MIDDLASRPWQRDSTFFYRRAAAMPEAPASPASPAPRQFEPGIESEIADQALQFVMPETPASPAPPRIEPQIQPEIADHALKFIAHRLRSMDPRATLNRLFSSIHVKDLQLIIALAFIAVVLVFVVGLVLSIESAIMSQQTDEASSHIAFTAVRSFLSVFGPVLGVFGAVFAWCYQIGSARLGVVDLFACEISTLCRVIAVCDTVNRYVDKFGKGPAAAAWAASLHDAEGGTRVALGHDAEGGARSALGRDAEGGARSALANHFVSQENYFPVFENNARDLQALEFGTVINITAFYTYVKAVRDTMRQLDGIGPHCWYDTMLNVIYMMFLSLESARKAIDDLIEYGPEEKVRIIEILISELEAYGFLRKTLAHDQVRYQLIMMRQPYYRELVPKIWREVESPSRESPGAWQWERARRLLPKLEKRFNEAMAAIT
jgi:hypothetical protein